MTVKQFIRTNRHAPFIANDLNKSVSKFLFIISLDTSLRRHIPAVDYDGTCVEVVVGTDFLPKQQQRVPKPRHTMIWPGGEVELLQVL